MLVAIMVWNRTFVSKGMLAENGMPRFGDVYDADTIEGIRAYVINEANSDRGKEFYESMSLGGGE